MSDLRVRSLDEDEIGTIISTDVEFEGDMSFEHPVLVRGRVSGSIASSDDVFVSEEATVSGAVKARRISVKGRVEAEVEAEQRLELFRTARLVGDVRTADLIVQSGARYSGRCTMPADEPEVTP